MDNYNIEKAVIPRNVKDQQTRENIKKSQMKGTTTIMEAARKGTQKDQGSNPGNKSEEKEREKKAKKKTHEKLVAIKR